MKPAEAFRLTGVMILLAMAATTLPHGSPAGAANAQGGWSAAHPRTAAVSAPSWQDYLRAVGDALARYDPSISLLDANL